MPELVVKKVVAICFLEAAKQTLEHLGAFRLELSQKGASGPAELPRLYGELRRLRDYLARCASAYQDSVTLELTDPDATLVVACCRRAVEAIEHRLVDGAVPPDEREWLIKKRTVLGDWAVELAAKPLVELPLHRLGSGVGEATRALNARLQDKVFGDVGKRLWIVAPGSSKPSLATGIEAAGDAAAVGSKPASDPQDAGDVGAAAREPAAAASAEPAGGAAAATPLLDHRKLRDPRLRALLGVDLAAFERCQAAGDHRLATVLLASVLESVLLDHAIPRRTEFGLTGPPDGWDLQELLQQAMGDAALPKDRALAFHLFGARNLLRPALQMVAPAVVTAASLDRLREFVERVLHTLGFGAPARGVPPGPLHANGLPQPTFDD